MAGTMKTAALLSFGAAVLFAVLYRFVPEGYLLTVAIACGTTAYHFGMRLLVGALFNRRMKNRADYTRKWYQVGPAEQKLYRMLRVKRWKGRMPTYDKAVFDPERHSWDEIAQAMCQSELVHETIIVLSFLPVTASVWFGASAVFWTTSALAAAFDLMFVMIQRYNRPRIVRLIRK